MQMICGKTLKHKINNKKSREMTSVETFIRVPARLKVAMVGACGENG